MAGLIAAKTDFWAQATGRPNAKAAANGAMKAAAAAALAAACALAPGHALAAPERPHSALEQRSGASSALEPEAHLAREPEGVGAKSDAMTEAKATASGEATAVCDESLTKLGADASASFGFFCRKAEILRECASQEGRAIQHLDLHGKEATALAKRERRILVFGLIHGDEPLSGRLALEWTKRLQEIEPRNAWRVVPILNPDGLRKNTRANARGVDLNRNFPTRDWDQEAMKHWEKSQRKDPRRFPGDAAASEAETQCAISHIKDFKPDFIVSIHTPYAVLDFDGPRMKFPAYKALPWRSLGNFPGSLGRYMWKDNNLPVLTIELKDKLVEPSQIQDVVGRLAIDASKASGARRSAELL